MPSVTIAKKSILVILALSIVAILIYFFNPAKDTRKKNIAVIYEDKIDRIVIENKQQVIILTKKNAGDWRLEENNFPIDPSRLSSFLQHFNFAEIQSLVARKPENHHKYSVADLTSDSRKEENGQRVKIFKKKKLVLDIIFGRIAYSPERVRFIRFAGEDEVYSSSIGKLPDLNTPEDGWLNKNLYHFDAGKISRFESILFEINERTQKEVFLLQDNKFVAQNSKKTTNGKTISDYLNRLANVEASPIVQKENLTKIATVSLELVDKTLLKIHQFKDKEKFYVRYELQNISSNWKLAQELSQKWIFQIPKGSSAILEEVSIKKFFNEKN